MLAACAPRDYIAAVHTIGVPRPVLPKTRFDLIVSYGSFAGPGGKSGITVDLQWPCARPSAFLLYSQRRRTAVLFGTANFAQALAQNVRFFNLLIFRVRACSDDSAATCGADRAPARLSH